jgi:hypothetical protein
MSVPYRTWMFHVICRDLFTFSDLRWETIVNWLLCTILLVKTIILRTKKYYHSNRFNISWSWSLNNTQGHPKTILNQYILSTATYSCLFHTGPGCSMWYVVIFLPSVIWGERRLLVFTLGTKQNCNYLRTKTQSRYKTQL